MLVPVTCDRRHQGWSHWSTSKAKTNTKPRTPERKSSSSSSDDDSLDKTSGPEPADKTVPTSKPAGKQQDPIELQKTFERFVIKEVGGVETHPDSPNETPLSITALTDSSTSTREFITQRSIAIQTVDCDYSKPLWCHRQCCIDKDIRVNPERQLNVPPGPDPNPPISTNDPRSSGLDSQKAVSEEFIPPNLIPVSDPGGTATDEPDNVNLVRQPTDRVLNASSNAVAIPDPKGNTVEPPSPIVAGNHAGSPTAGPHTAQHSESSKEETAPVLDMSSHSDTSLLDYIDSEYESVKQRNLDMYNAKRDDRASSEQERRIAALEANYERVVKRKTTLAKFVNWKLSNAGSTILTRETR